MHERSDIGDESEEAHGTGRAEPIRHGLQSGALGAVACYQELDGAQLGRGLGDRGDEHIVTLARDQSGSDTEREVVVRDADGAAAVASRCLAGLQGRRVDSVGNNADAVGRSEARVAEKVGDVLGDGDPSPRQSAGESAGTAIGLLQIEGRGAVHRRDAGNSCGFGGELAVDICVHQVRVNDVGSERPDLAEELGDDHRIHVGARRKSRRVHPCGAQRVDESIAARRSEHAHLHVDPRRGQRREQREEMTLRPADALRALNMKYAHGQCVGGSAPMSRATSRFRVP